MDQNVNVRPETLKLPEENMEKTLEGRYRHKQQLSE
jgi:hypothetical protein